MHAKAQPSSLRADSLLVDLDYLEELLTTTHPGIYRYQSSQDISAHFAMLRRTVQKRDLTEREWMIELAQLVREIRCGHTYLNPWNMKKSIRERLFGGAIYLPLGFQIIDDRFIVTENLTDYPTIERGDEIVNINGFSVPQILDSLKTIAKRDGENSSSLSRYLSLDEFGADRWEAFDLYFHLFFEVEDFFTLKIISSEGASNDYTVNALTKEARARQYRGDSLEKWNLEFVQDKAIMKLGTFATWKWKNFDHEEWFAEAFAKIDSAGAGVLVIDIRGNEGGLGAIGIELLSYFEGASSACEIKLLTRTLKVDEKFRAYSDTYCSWAFSGLREGQYEALNDQFYLLNEQVDCDPIVAKEASFSGPIYFLGGPSNVSATFTLLERSKQLTNSVFVGGETGGNQQGINGGEYLFFYLPYSGMEVDVPLKYFSRGRNNINGGVQPDFVVRPSKSALANGEDLHLLLVDHLIANENQLTEAYLFSLLTAEWAGQLTYLDYRSGKRVDIPADLKVSQPKQNTILMEYQYPDEPHMNSSERITLDLLAKTVEGRRITEIANEDGKVIIIAEAEGVEDGVTAMLRFTYQISAEAFSITREFRKNEGSEYQTRNSYVFRRKK